MALFPPFSGWVAMLLRGEVSRGAKGADCKSAVLGLRRFESFLPHPPTPSASGGGPPRSSDRSEGGLMPSHGNGAGLDCFVASAFHLRSASFGGRGRSWSYGGQVAPRHGVASISNITPRSRGARRPSCASIIRP